MRKASIDAGFPRKAHIEVGLLHAGIDARFRWSPKHVQDVCTFIEQLPHVEGRWPTPTIHLEPWQVFILAAVYGFRRPDGGRLVTTVFFEVAQEEREEHARRRLRALSPGRRAGTRRASRLRRHDRAARRGSSFSIMQRMVRRARLAARARPDRLRQQHHVRCDRRLCEADQRKSITQDGLNPSSSASMKATRRTSSCTMC